MNDTPLTPGSFPESDETRPPEEITPTPHTESQSENSTLSEEAPLPSIEDPVHGDPSEATGAAYTPEAPKAPEMPYTPECPRASVNAPVPEAPEMPYMSGSPKAPEAPYAPRPQSSYQSPYGYPPHQRSYPQGNPGCNPGYGSAPRRNPNYDPGYGSAPQGNPNYDPGYGSVPQENPNYDPANPGYRTGAPGYGPGNYGFYQGGPFRPFPPVGSPYAPPSANAPPKKKKKSSPWLLVLLIVGCILIGTVSGILIAKTVGEEDGSSVRQPTQQPELPSRPSGDKQPPTESNIPRETHPLATSNGELMTLNEIYSANVPAIVGITNEATQDIFGKTATSVSAGSGFIISSDGEILTNYHVVEGAQQLTVTLYDGREYPATLVGYEAESDIALIKIEEEGLPVCAIGNSDQVFVGEQIAAIGNPMGELTYTMTVGYVSAMDRFVNTDNVPINMIQVDAAINPGNSGGPVFNLYGEVIGIATAKYSGALDGGATLEGLGFAIPINDITEILDDLRISGRVPDRAYMGVMVSMLPIDEATFGIDHGIFVQSVDEGGSAFKAGVQANDIILKIGDVELNAYENLQKTLRKYRAGDETTITVYRNGETITMPIVFDAKPETTEPVTEVVPLPKETETPTEPESTTEDPWGDFPWGDFPWGDFGG